MNSVEKTQCSLYSCECGSLQLFRPSDVMLSLNESVVNIAQLCGVQPSEHFHTLVLLESRELI